jgi:hypothetical protein
VVVGAGLLLEATRLAELGWKVDALETPASVDRRREIYAHFAASPSCRVVSSGDKLARYGLAVCTHVLEFVEDPAERLGLLRLVVDRLSTDGLLLLSLRGWSDVSAARRAVPRGDGIVTGLGTWTRGFSVEEAKEMVRGAGLRVTAMPNPKSKTPEQVRFVCRPETNDEKR